MSKKSSKKHATTTEKRPAKRKKIVSLAQYEAQAKAEKKDQPKDDVTATVEAVEKGDLAGGITVPVGKKRQPKTDKPASERKPSGLDAAVAVLAKAGKPLNTKTMVERMLAQGLWSTGGKTPAATIYAAIITEIAKKGDQSRFRKTERGHFELTAAGIAARTAAGKQEA